MGAAAPDRTGQAAGQQLTFELCGVQVALADVSEVAHLMQAATVVGRPMVHLAHYVWVRGNFRLAAAIVGVPALGADR